MKYEKLGNSDLSVSKICLGTMTFGQQNTEAEAHDQLDYAIDSGINFLDTAEMYPIPANAKTQGLTEKYIGSWLKKRNKRDDLIIASKVIGPSDIITWIRPNLNFSRVHMQDALDLSLQRLQTSYIDLYQLHWPERKTNCFGKLGFEYDPEDQWQDNFYDVLVFLQDCIKGGKIRYIGLSNETPWGFMRCLHLAQMFDLPKVVSVQNPYNLLNRSYEVGMAEMSIRENAKLLAYSPLAFGLLSGKYHKKNDKPDNRLNQFKGYNRYSGKMAWTATQRYLEVSAKFGISLTHMALAFVNSRPFLTSNIIGATSLQQLKENIESLDTHLPNDLLEEIESIHQEISNPAP